MTYTAEEAAKILGIVVRTVTKWCARYGVPKHGTGYLITDEHIELMRNRDSKPGRK